MTKLFSFWENENLLSVKKLLLITLMETNRRLNLVWHTQTLTSEPKPAQPKPASSVRLVWKLHQELANEIEKPNKNLTNPSLELLALRCHEYYNQYIWFTTLNFNLLLFEQMLCCVF